MSLPAGVTAPRLTTSALASSSNFSFHPLAHPVVFSLPRRLTPYSAWHDHIPFAMYLVSLLRPRVIVELGTQGGDSYCAFCQAVQELNLDARCYAIDTWQGDAHVGYYGPEILNDLRAFHDPLYGSFSQLIQSTFSAALDHFPAASIDLLHLDGYHTYEAARTDFEQWLCKLSPRGVVLLHDTNERERDFGVCRLWDELVLSYPHWEFFNGHGLGLLSVGPEAVERLASLFNASAQEALFIRTFFFRLAQGMTAGQASAAPLMPTGEAQEIKALGQELGAQARVNESLIAQLTIKEQNEQNLTRELQSQKEWLNHLMAEKTGLEQHIQTLTTERNQVQQEMERAQLTDRQRISALEQTLAEQTQHIDALTIRLERMSTRETELRTLLLDAHAELWDRDQELDRLVTAGHPLSKQTDALAFLQAEVANLNRIVAARDEGIDWLRAELADAQGQVHTMQNSRLWRLGSRYRKIQSRLLAALGHKP